MKQKLNLHNPYQIKSSLLLPSTYAIRTISLASILIRVHNLPESITYSM